MYLMFSLVDCSSTDYFTFITYLTFQYFGFGRTRRLLFQSLALDLISMFLLLSPGRYDRWWTISTRWYHPHSSQCLLNILFHIDLMGRHGHDRVIVRCITTNKLSLVPFRRGILETSYVIKFVSDLRQFGGFFWGLRFLTPIKLTATT